MQRPELVEKILDYINKVYEAKYIGLIQVKQEGDIYTLTLGIPSYMMQTHICYQSDTDQEFLLYIYEELRTRNYMRLDIYKVTRENDPKEE